MKDKIIQLLTNLKLEETEPIHNGIKRFIANADFSITVNRITIFLDCNEDKKMTYIEIDEDQIAFRSEFDHNQTTFIIFSFNEINEMEIKINGNYHYF